MTEKDLLGLGMIEDPPGSGKFRKRSNNEGRKPRPVSVHNNEGKSNYSNIPAIVPLRDIDVSYEIVVDPLPAFFLDGGGKKHYLTANFWYGYNIHPGVRLSIKNQCSTLLVPYIRDIITDAIPPGKTFRYILSGAGSKKQGKISWDLNNKAYFWDKTFTDLLQEVNLLKEDNVYNIPRVIYEFDPTVKKDRLVIQIY